MNATAPSAAKFKFSLEFTVLSNFAPEFRQTCVQASSCYHLIPVKSQLSSKNRLPSEYGFGPTISILVDKIVYSKFSDFNSISSFKKQFVYKVRERLE